MTQYYVHQFKTMNIDYGWKKYTTNHSRINELNFDYVVIYVETLNKHEAQICIIIYKYNLASFNTKINHRHPFY